jgi:hypothetical protein
MSEGIPFAKSFDYIAVDLEIDSSVFDQIERVGDIVLTIDVASSRILPLCCLLDALIFELSRNMAEQTVILHDVANDLIICFFKLQLNLHCLSIF